jgi:hypothetical protein
MAFGLNPGLALFQPWLSALALAAWPGPVTSPGHEPVLLASADLAAAAVTPGLTWPWPISSST